MEWFISSKKYMDNDRDNSYVGWNSIHHRFFDYVIVFISNGQPVKLLVLICAWALVQSGLALSGFYLHQSTFPRFILVLLPAFLFMGYGLLPQNITWMLSKRDVRLSTFLHTVRLPIEIIFFKLYLNKMISQLMTFEGRNFDIVIGITAPIVGYLYL